ncbi:hypothetical protein NPIL_396501 [Nephila pilipes]|uniref:Uncharacterized protein n=1 Tax=Nephila pilipes TaxID=299642 RepID=A0A8X6N0F5_NEPPI|nr:hypothetical protein NPIL_396501 [Nephila pilipes]
MQCNYYSLSRFVKVSVRNFKFQHLPDSTVKRLLLASDLLVKGRVIGWKGGECEVSDWMRWVGCRPKNAGIVPRIFRMNDALRFVYMIRAV